MPERSSTQNSSRFEAALRLFDEENAKDPNRVLVNNVSHPREWIYARWLGDWVSRLRPDAPEALLLAARCQHLCRWMIPREDFPMTRAGYLRWRESLKSFHAQKAGEVLRRVGYPDETVLRVQELNRKTTFPDDPESRVLEDALCLVFLERQLVPLADKTSQDKIITALRKSWQKMSPAGRDQALKLSFAPREKALLDLALKP